jgi:hypothetical protein
MKNIVCRAAFVAYFFQLQQKNIPQKGFGEKPTMLTPRGMAVPNRAKR